MLLSLTQALNHSRLALNLEAKRLSPIYLKEIIKEMGEEG